MSTREIADHIVNPANDRIKIVVVDAPGAGGACHEYQLVPANGRTHNISFQNGPIAEMGVNGITQEALLAVVLDRLRSFQKGSFACRENACAITKDRGGNALAATAHTGADAAWCRRQERTMSQPYSVVASAMQTLVTTKGARRVTKIVAKDRTVKVTRQHKPRRDKQEVFLVTIGKPNFVERRHIKSCMRSGTPITKAPIVQLFPAKKAA